MNIYSYTLEKFENYFESIGEKKFHARQVFKWLYEKMMLINFYLDLVMVI